MVVSLNSEPSLLTQQQTRLAELIGYLLSNGWSHKELSQAIGVDISTLYRWSKGKTVPEQDSKNFYQLAKVSGGTNRGLQLYLEGKISLSDYCEGNYQSIEEDVNNNKRLASLELKKEILLKTRSLETVDIVEIIASLATYLSKKAM